MGSLQKLVEPGIWLFALPGHGRQLCADHRLPGLVQVPMLEPEQTLGC
jgi:hypothetical protein